LNFFSGRHYYANITTGEVSWNPPGSADTQQAAAAAAAAAEQAAAAQKAAAEQAAAAQKAAAEQAQAATRPSVNSASESGWKEMKDPNSGKTYYANVKTGKTQWVKPVELEEKSSTAAVPAPATAGDAAQPSSAWQEMKHPTTGQTYYANPQTGQVQWTIPDELKTQVESFSILLICVIW